jgi:hypothetical protein
MCLEDRLLVALYKEAGLVPMTEMADRISITDTAALSIIHRIRKTYPEFIREEGDDSNLRIGANSAQEAEVASFLAGGGFTAINEEEFRQYYLTELESYNRFQRLKHNLQEKVWIRWATGLGFALGGGLLLARRLKSNRL